MVGDDYCKEGGNWDYLICLVVGFTVLTGYLHVRLRLGDNGTGEQVGGFVGIGRGLMAPDWVQACVVAMVMKTMVEVLVTLVALILMVMVALTLCLILILIGGLDDDNDLVLTMIGGNRAA